MNRRQFLQRLGIGVGACVAAPLLAKVPFTPKLNWAKELREEILKTKKFYPWVDKKGEILPLHPDNVAIRAESDRMISSFKTPEEYAAIFGRANYYHSIGNDAEAGYAATKASKLLPCKWCPPKEVLGLTCMLKAYGIRYDKEVAHRVVPCGKHPSP